MKDKHPTLGLTWGEGRAGVGNVLFEYTILVERFVTFIWKECKHEFSPFGIERFSRVSPLLQSDVCWTSGLSS